MCGRYSFAVEPKKDEKRFHAQFVGEYAPRYNAAPSQNLPVILNEAPNEIRPVHWGLKPPWLAKLKKRDGLINVRAETLREKPTFRGDFLRRRCLVLADGFYEWKKSPSGRKIPYRFTLRDGRPFALAGIWEVNEDALGRTMKTFAIITTRANALMSPIHDRMPVILRPEAEATWLSGETAQPELFESLEPFADEKLRAFEVSPAVNQASMDSKEAIVPV